MYSATCHSQWSYSIWDTEGTNLYFWRWECTISELVTLIIRERSAVGGKASEVRAIPPGHYCNVKSQPDKDPQE